MSAQLAFQAPKVPILAAPPTSHLFSWSHSPICAKGSKPTVEESGIVTVQVVPTFQGQFQNGAHLADAVLFLAWSAAKQGQMTAEVDLVRGTAFSIVASELDLSVKLMSNIAIVGVNDPAYAIISGTIGRYTRPGGTSVGPTRTRFFGSVLAGNPSAAQLIPNLGKRMSLVSATAGAGAGSVIQLANGVVVQTDTFNNVSGSVFLVNPLADSVLISNTSLANYDASIIFTLEL